MITGTPAPVGASAGAVVGSSGVQIGNEEATK